MHLANCDNLLVEISEEADLIFADYVYENTNFEWLDYWWKFLKVGGVFIAMTDFHSIFELGIHLKSMDNSFFINHLAWKNEWGNHPKDRFHQCFDDIVIFSKGKHSKFYSDRIQIDKATKNTGLNPSGRDTKTATAFINDICLTTTSKERVYNPSTNKLIQWQKPLALMQRLIDPFTDEGDFVVDLFMGSGTLAVWCKNNNRRYLGIEKNKGIFELAKERIGLE